MPAFFTVNRFQFVVPEDEREEPGPGAQTQRWRPLQAVVAQVQVLQFTQGLRRATKQSKVLFQSEG